MHRSSFFFAAIVISIMGIGMYGCTSSEPATPATSTDHSSDTTAAEMDHSEHDHASQDHNGEVDVSDMDKMKAELAKLPEADRIAAEKQHMCPVSGEMLGTMGPPRKVEVNGRQVWICCDGCKDQLLENPDEYLAKLKKD